MRKAIYRNTHQDVAKALKYIGDIYATLGDKSKHLEYYIQSYAVIVLGKNMDVKLKKIKDAVDKILSEGGFKLTDAQLYGTTRSMVVSHSVSTEELLLKKKQIQPQLNELSTLAEHGDVAGVEKYITKTDLNSDELAGVLYFEAINLGIMRGSKELGCPKAFLAKYPVLINKVAREHPDFFIDGSIVKACTVTVTETQKKLIEENVKIITKENANRLLLYFDINGTLILKDTSKKTTAEEMINSALADATFHKWDPKSDKPIAFRKYVDTVLAPGDKANQDVKNARRKLAYNFVSWLKTNNHPLYNAVNEDYKKIMAKLHDPATGQLSVFSSFYALLKKLREQKISFSIILRTFGSDLKEVATEIEKHQDGFKLKYWGKYNEQTLTINEQVKNDKEAFTLYIESSNDHFAIQDDWAHWNKHGEKGSAGKTFLFDKKGNWNSTPNLSLFFDDNITGEEYDIVRPVDVSGTVPNVTTKDLFEDILIPVLTKEAMLDDNYFINKVNAALAKGKK